MGRIKDLTQQARFPAADDFMDLDGATNGSRKITPTDLLADPLNGRAPRPGIVSAGTGYIGMHEVGKIDIGTNDVTLGMWVRATYSGGTTYQLAGNDNFTSSQATSSLRTAISSFPGEGLVAVLRPASGSSIVMTSGNSGLTDGAWVFAVLRLDRDGNGQWYINGAASGSAVDISSFAAESFTSSTAWRWLSSVNSGGSYTPGTLGECWIVNGLLSAARIADIYRAGSIAPFCSYTANTTTGVPVATIDGLSFFTWPDFARADPQNNPIAVDRSGNNQHALLGASGLTPAVPLQWRNTVPSHAIVSNGAAGSRVYSTLNTQNPGTGEVVLLWEGLFPQDATSAARRLAAVTSNLTTPLQAKSFLLSYSTSLGVYISLTGATTADHRTLGSTALHTHLAALGARGIWTALVVRRNLAGIKMFLGIGRDAARFLDVTYLFSETTGGTPPAWTDEIDGDYLVSFYSTSSVSSANALADLRLANVAMTEAQLRTEYERGEPGAEWVGASKAALTSGTLVRGGTYRINTYVAGDSFTNVGAASNTTGVVFVATGTTPTTWTNGSSLERLGLTTRLDTSTAAGLTALNPAKSATNDSSDFLLSATGVTVAPDNRRQIIRPGTLTFTSPGTLNLQLFGSQVVDTRFKWRVVSFSGTSNASVNLSLGNASAGEQYVSAQAVTSGDFDIATFASRRLSGANLWLKSDATVTITNLVIILERVD